MNMQQIIDLADSLGLPVLLVGLLWLGWKLLKDVRDGIKDVRTELGNEINNLRSSFDDLKNILIKNYSP